MWTAPSSAGRSPSSRSRPGHRGHILSPCLRILHGDLLRACHNRPSWGEGRRSALHRDDGHRRAHSASRRDEGHRSVHLESLHERCHIEEDLFSTHARDVSVVRSTYPA